MCNLPHSPAPLHWSLHCGRAHHNDRALTVVDGLWVTIFEAIVVCKLPAGDEGGVAVASTSNRVRLPPAMEVTTDSSSPGRPVQDQVSAPLAHLTLGSTRVPSTRTVRKMELIQKAKLAKVAEQAERYDDMATCIKAVNELGAELSKEECNLLLVAYKNVVAFFCHSGCRVCAYSKTSDKKLLLIKDYQEKVELDLGFIYTEVLELLDKYLIANATNPESKVFYMKMKGDYFQYLAEVACSDDRKQMIDNSQGAYREAFDISKKQMHPTYLIHLELALNLSVFYYEIFNNPELTCTLAKTAFDEAIVEPDTLNEDSYSCSSCSCLETT
ncbi:14-3-3 protein theta [Tupaia chinensis]|uniref:14-3-3 protein theta n=1 Tax=Tupaia chinensis TaxID=246437 RepID=L9JS59_TUPCH|nr:14-3-3 protein theta [Tupaia chinensis]